MTTEILSAQKPTIAERFAAFHAEHPEVYAELRRLALDAVRRLKRTHLGIGMLWEVMRWNIVLDCEEGGYKLNNDLRPHYADLLMVSEPELVGVFETRRRRAS